MSDLLKPELYEIYRRGLITRHLCSNGRVDQRIWLRQVPRRWTDPRLDPNCRSNDEICTRPDDTPVVPPDGVPGAPVTMRWRPLCRHWDLPQSSVDPRTGLPRDLAAATSYASGENPLMTAGVTLAAFSMEAMCMSSAGRQYAMDLARRIFRYICECELPSQRGGCLLRIESYHPKHHPFLASTDELLGVCVGLLYYHRALRGNAAGQAQVVALVERIAASLGAHGFWLFPWSEDYEFRADILTNAFYNSAGGSVFWKQCCWAFGAAFRAFFRQITGKDFTASWNKVEREAYCRPTINFPHKQTILSQLDSRMVDLVAAAPTDSELFFKRICQAITATAHAHQSGAPGGWQVLIEIGSAALSKTPGTGAVLGALALSDAEKSVFSLIFDGLKGNYFNFHMFALASLLLVECGASSETRQAAGALMSALLKDVDGRKNSLFALVLKKCLPTNDAQAEYSEAINVLTTVPTGGASEVFDHDLGLATFDLPETVISMYKQVQGQEGLSRRPARGLLGIVVKDDPDPWLTPAGRELRRLSAATGLQVKDLVAALTTLSVNFNPYDRWGGALLWDSKADGRLTGAVGYDPGGTDPVEILRELLRSPDSRDETGQLLAMTQETCGAGLLFARMLAAYWRLLPPPELGANDNQWPILPFAGATPVPERRPGAARPSPGRREDPAVPPGHLRV